MNCRRNTLLAGIASLALVASAGAGWAQTQEKEKAPAAKPPAAATMNKGPTAAEKPKTAAPGPRAEEMNRPKATENKMAEPKAGTEGAKPAQKAEENERMTEPKRRAEEKEENKQTPQRAEENERNKQTPQRAEENERNKQTPQRAEENERNKQTPQRAEENERNKQTPQRAEENERNNKTGQTATEQNRTEHNRAAAAHVKLSTEQRTRIKSVVLAGHGGPRVAHVNFDVRVGTVVPRGSVEYVPVPETLVSIEPAWAGFYYFIYGEEVVIIDPDTLAIVAVVEV